MSDITKNTTIENIPEETPEQAELDRLIDEGDYILKVKHLKKYFPVATDFFGRPTQYVRAVDDVTFGVKAGCTVGIVGESGCGKTTMGRTILRLHSVTGGEVVFEGKDLAKLSNAEMRKLRPEIQMIFQDPMASLNERAKVDYIVSEGLMNVQKRLSKEEREAKVSKALSDVGLLPEFASRFPHEFSGGQRQRIGIARALIVEPEFIVADEPISALDMSIRAQVLNLLRQLQKQRGITYLFIAHDLSVMRYISDRIAVIRKGKKVFHKAVLAC